MLSIQDHQITSPRKTGWTLALAVVASFQHPLRASQHSGPLIDPALLEAPNGPRLCSDRFGTSFLQSLAQSPVQYCEMTSISALTCFHTQRGPEEHTDLFCIGGPALYDVKSSKFELDCPLKVRSMRDITEGCSQLEDSPNTWYETGPSLILKQHLRLDRSNQSRRDLPRSAPSSRRNFTILIKREQTGHDVWHALRDLFALSISLDVLRMKKDPKTNTPSIQEDIDNTQILLLDDLLDGPFFYLWNLFAKRPTTKLSGIFGSSQLQSANIIVPLSGGGNTFWQGGWDTLPCTFSDLLHTFSQRVLNFHRIADGADVGKRPLMLTFVSRTSKRHLINKQSCIEMFKTNFPMVDVQLVDVETLPFSQQLDIIHRTDILVDVHGAGLTHSMFLPPRSAVVESLAHGSTHKGFRNLAEMLEHRYFSNHGIECPMYETTGHWQYNEVCIEVDQLMDILRVAIISTPYGK